MSNNANAFKNQDITSKSAQVAGARYNRFGTSRSNIVRHLNGKPYIHHPQVKSHQKVLQIFSKGQKIWNQKLIFIFILTALATTTNVLPSLKIVGAVAQNESTSSSVNSEERKHLTDGEKFASTGIAIAIVTGIIVSSCFYQKKRRSRQIQSLKNIDRYQEEFLCGPLAKPDLSPSPANTSRPNARVTVAEPKKKEISVSPTEEVDIVAEPAPTVRSYSLSDECQEFIEKIVTRILKGQVMSPELIYHQLMENVRSGKSEIFERCLIVMLNTTQEELDQVIIAPSFFQRDTPHLKQARLNRRLKALQSIQAQWERVQKQPGR